jgi:hypothetical protein
LIHGRNPSGVSSAPSDHAALSRVHGDAAALNPSGRKRLSRCRAAEEDDEFKEFKWWNCDCIQFLTRLNCKDRAQQDIKFARIGQRASGRVRSSAHEPGILGLEIGDDFVSRRRPSGRLHWRTPAAAIAALER